MAELEYTTIAISDLGTQLFWWNEKALEPKFEYAVPVTAGADFSGDQESVEVPETDLDYIPKISIRRNLNDTEYTLNYTAEKYKRARAITDATNPQTYMEVLNDGSAMIFKGTCAMPGIVAGDARQISMPIVPSFTAWVNNIYDIDEDSLKDLESQWYDTDSSTSKKYIKIDATTVPTARQYYVSTSEDKPTE